MPRHYVDFTMDGSAAGMVNGYISGIADNISTKQYIESAVSFTTSTLSALFEAEMDAVAKAQPERYYHVYNWGKTYNDRSPVGDPENRLWKLVSTGSGKGRQIGFTFLPEHVPTPIEPELLKGKRKVNTGVHIFTWKAVVMEYGIEVEIRPKLPGVKTLAFVDDTTGKVIFRKGPIHTIPGYRTTTGMFSSFFISWWTQAAPGMYEKFVKPELERDVVSNADLAKISRQATRRRRKDLGISIIDFRTGEALAKAHMDRNRIDYARRARRRRLNLYGY